MWLLHPSHTLHPRQTLHFSHADASFGHTHLRTDPSSGITHKAQPSGISRKASVEDPENSDLAVSDAENLAESGTKKVDAGILAGGGAIKEGTDERNLGGGDDYSGDDYITGSDDCNVDDYYYNDDYGGGGCSGKSPKSPKSPKSAKSAKSKGAKGGYYR